MPTVLIEAYVNDDCNIVVNDVTINLSDDWSNGALFWSIDAFSTTEGADLTNPGDLEWIIPAVNQNQYYIYVFYAMSWTNGGTGTWLANSICYNHGGFYKNISGGPIAEGVGVTEPYLDAVHWELMDDSNYADFVTAMGVGGPRAVLRSNLEVVLISCNMFKVFQTTECYQWKVCDVSGLANDKTVNVYAYGSNTVLSTYDLTAGDCVTITLPDDGVYIIEIVYTTAIPPAEGRSIYEYHLAYETCKIKTCWTALVNSILCNEWDPCCVEPCSETQKEALRVKRDTLNMMTALVIDLLASMLVEHTQYMNILLTYQDGNAEATRNVYIQRVKDNIERLLIIVGRCGECTQTTTSSVEPCSSC